MIHQDSCERTRRTATLIEIGLFENDTVVDAGNIFTGIARTAQHLAVITLRSSLQCGKQVVTDLAHIQFVHAAATSGGDPGAELIVAQSNFLQTVEVVIVRGGLNGPDVGTGGTVKLRIGFDQVVIDRVAQVGQIDPAECTVPVGAIALAARPSPRLSAHLMTYQGFPSGQSAVQLRANLPNRVRLRSLVVHRVHTPSRKPGTQVFKIPVLRFCSCWRRLTIFFGFIVHPKTLSTTSDF